MPLCTQRTGCFLLSSDQIVRIHDNHIRILTNVDSLPSIPHECQMVPQIQMCMIAILKARNVAEAVEPPDDFDFSPYLRPEPTQQHTPDVRQSCGDDVNNSGPISVPKPVHRPTHSPEGFLLSTSARPGGSKYQYVQLNVSQNQTVSCYHST